MKRLYIALVLLLILELTVGVSAETYVDGIYSGTAEGFSSDIKVRVVIVDGQIINIVADHDEIEQLGGKAIAELIDLVLEDQTVPVDSATGATISSRAFIAAMNEALAKAADSDAPGADPSVGSPLEPDIPVIEWSTPASSSDLDTGDPMPSQVTERDGLIITPMIGIFGIDDEKAIAYTEETRFDASKLNPGEYASFAFFVWNDRADETVTFEKPYARIDDGEELHWISGSREPKSGSYYHIFYTNMQNVKPGKHEVSFYTNGELYATACFILE